LEISEIGFYTEKITKIIKENETLTDQVSLRRSYYVIQKIITNENKVAQQLKIVPGEYNMKSNLI